MSRTAFLFGFEEAALGSLADRLLEEYAIDCVWWFHTSPVDPQSVRKTCVPVSIHDINFGMFENLPSHRLSSMVARNLSSPPIRFIESLVMMNRYRHHTEMIDIFADVPSLVDRVAKVYAYWEILLSELQPVVVLFSRIPHDGADFIASEVAHAACMNCVYLNQLQVHRTVQVTRDFRDPIVPTSWRDEGHEGILPERMEIEFQSRIALETPWYMATRGERRGVAAGIARRGLDLIRKSSNSARDRVRSLDLAAVDAVGRQLVFGRRSEVDLRNLVERDRKRLEKEIRGGEFLYLPLHLTPEMTTSPLGGPFATQLNLVRLASSAAQRMGLHIVLKENPKQIQHFRGSEFWREVGMSPDVVVADPFYSSASLIRSARAVLTVTGTAGWESIFAGVGSVVCGYPFYRNAPGVFSLTDASDFESLVERAVGWSVESDLETIQDDLQCYLAALAERTIDGWVSGQFARSASGGEEFVSDPGNIESLFAGVLSVLRGVNV